MPVVYVSARNFPRAILKNVRPFHPSFLKRFRAGAVCVFQREREGEREKEREGELKAYNVSYEIRVYSIHNGRAIDGG